MRAVWSYLVCFSLLALPLRAAVIESDFLAPGDGLLTYDDVHHREWLDLTQTSLNSLIVIQTAMLPGGLYEGFSFATLKDVEELALSAGVPWQDPEALNRFGEINGTLIPKEGFAPVNVGSREAAQEAKSLFDLLGNVLTFEISEIQVKDPFFSIFTATYLFDSSVIQTTVSSHYSFGQIADGFVDGEPHLSGTSVTVFFYDSSITPSILPASRGGSGGIAVGIPEVPGGVPLPTGNEGPFWLYRTAIPEPSSLTILAVGVLSISFARKRL
ncbi:MAG: hypothetical protein KDA57_17290 [Planctomycetales bacterium]|nr:hypothetical protein [Planctomycetales bacterium]